MKKILLADLIHGFKVTPENLNIPIDEFSKKVYHLHPECKRLNPGKELYVCIGKDSMDVTVQRRGTYKAEMSALIREHVISFHHVGMNR